ncbi:MAG TPA: amidohydrolase family protein [Caulobacteraceae bacterium]|nr:amidohydrolase family protein [Caulobacteraceae bacterium]
MLIVDAQIHPWARGEATGHHRKSPITTEILLQEMASAGVDRAILVPPLWDRGGNAYALSAAKAHPDRFAVMGLPPAGGFDPKNGRGRLTEWMNQPGMAGLRFLFNAPDRAAPLLDGALEWIWPLAEDLGLVVAMLAPGRLDRVAGIAERHPRLKLIVDHLGVPRGASGPRAFDHLPELIALSRFANVSVKAVAVCDYAQDVYPFPSVEAPLRRVFDAFGPGRVMWGSDLSRLKHSYRECVTHFTEGLPWLSDDDLRQVMGTNMCRMVGWMPPVAA